MTEKKTSWGAVAEWYDNEVIGDDDSYQKKVIEPNLLRILEPKTGMNIIDIACGQGYFANLYAKDGAAVTGCDISPELIDLAKKNSTEVGVHDVMFKVAPSDSLKVAPRSFDAATIVLALQNIENLSGTIAEVAASLKKGGRLIIILNHPAFRIPKASSWQFDEANNTQFRRIDSYMSDKTVSIDMNPGQSNSSKKKTTISFHRPLQSYFKALAKAGFAVTRLEEWISHKKSQAGPKAKEEDRIRKEIPMFICIEATLYP